MKRGKRALAAWLLAGVMVSLVTLAFVAFGVNHGPVVLVDEGEVRQAAERTLECARTGDFDALADMLYGAPELGDFPEGAQGLMLQAYLQSIQYALPEHCRAAGDALALDVSITCLDLDAVTQAMQIAAPRLLTQLAEQEKDAYDQSHVYREDFLSDALPEVAAQVLAGATQTADREVTLCLRRTRAGWQVEADEALTQLLTGFVSG